MRSRQEINGAFNTSPRNEGIVQNQKLILEVMLDIRTISITMESKVAGQLAFFRSAMGEDFNEVAFKTCQISELTAMHKMLDTPLAQVEQLSREISDVPQRRNEVRTASKTSLSGNASIPIKDSSPENPGPIFEQDEDDDPTPL